MTSLNQDTQTESGLKNIIQISRRQHDLFQVSKSFTPKPPCSFVSVTVSQATLAEFLESVSPFHKKVLHKEFIFFMQALGSMKEEHQNVVIPDITVFVSNKRPEKDKVFTDQELNFAFTCCSRVSQPAMESFLEFKGTPRYRNGSDPHDMPVEAWIISISACSIPEAKNDVF